MDKIVWLVLMLLFLMVESASITMVSLWFGFGALAALIAALCGAQLWLQTVLFFGVSILLLASLRPLVRKFLTPKITRTNVDSIVGTKGLVTDAIDNVSAQGQVKLNGMEWSARSTSGETIEAGTLVRVDRVEGVKVFVSPVQVDATV